MKVNVFAYYNVDLIDHATKDQIHHLAYKLFQTHEYHSIVIRFDDRFSFRVELRNTVVLPFR